MFGFSSHWINWVQECLSSISYSILLYGSPYGFIIPTHELRQRDPLSPFLFVISMKILSHMLEKINALSIAGNQFKHMRSKNHSSSLCW